MNTRRLAAGLLHDRRPPAGANHQAGHTRPAFSFAVPLPRCIVQPMITTRVLLLTLLASSAWGADTAEETRKRSAREALKARIAEDAKKTAPAATTAKPAPNPIAPAPDNTPEKPDAKAKASTPAKTKSKNAGKETPTVLPQVEVKKGRITELDQQLAKQQQEIEREKKNLKSSEVDDALNDAKIARPLAIFGGDSTQFRKGVASERVELMEAEKDIMEAIAHAKTKEEKAALQKQLTELKAMRRELDRALR